MKFEGLVIVCILKINVSYISYKKKFGKGIERKGTSLREKAYEDKHSLLPPLFFVHLRDQLNIAAGFFSVFRGPALDIGFVMDSSSAVNWAQVQNFAKWLVGKTTVSAEGAHFGFIPYASTAKTAFAFNTFSGAGYTSEAVNGRIDNIAQVGGNERRLGSALNVAFRSLFTTQGGARSHAKKVPYLMTVNYHRINLNFKCSIKCF